MGCENFRGRGSESSNGGEMGEGCTRAEEGSGPHKKSLTCSVSLVSSMANEKHDPV